MLNILYEIIFIAIDKFVPLKRFPIWFSVDLKNFTLEKKKAHKKYKNTHSVDDYQEFSRLRLLCKSLTQECYNQYVYCTELAINLNIKKCWSFVNNKRKNSSFPNELKYLNKSSCSGEDIADMFAEYFPQFTQTIILTFPHMNFPPLLFTFLITIF